MKFKFDYKGFSTDEQFDSIETAIKVAYKIGNVEAIRLVSNQPSYTVIWSAEKEADSYDFSTYTRDDIIDDLFMFTDTLEDNDILTTTEKAILAKLKQRWLQITTS